MHLLSTWVKHPGIRGADLCIVSECLQSVNPRLFEELTRGCVTLLACPEKEGGLHYGKLAMILRTAKPSSLKVVTIDGSPHCIQLHAAANAAELLLGRPIPKKHVVVVDGVEPVEVDPMAVRVSRYLSVVDRLFRERREEVLRELAKHSIEVSEELARRRGSA